MALFKVASIGSGLRFRVLGLGLHDSEKPSALYRCDELVCLRVSGFGFQVAKVCGTLNPELPLVTSVISKANGIIPKSPGTLRPQTLKKEETPNPKALNP